MPYPKFNKTLIVSLLPALIWGLSACGGAEENEAPAEATVAIEAGAETPAKSAENVEAEPTEATESGAGASAQAAPLREPAGPSEIAEVIDLRDMPTLPATASLGEPEIGSLSYQTSEKIPAVLDFYRPKLVEMGWEELPDSYIEEATAMAYFTKGDFILYLGASQMGEDQVMVSLINHGNVDVRALPVYPEAEMLFADSATSSIYVTPAKVEDVVQFTREELAALGWKEYIRPNTSYADNPDQQSLSFIQNGLELSAFIGTAPAQEGKTTNQYSVRVLSHALPVMEEASGLEFDEYEVYLSYGTEAEAETVKDFYSQSLAEMGYELVEETNATDGSLLFSNDEMPLLLSFPTEGDQTQVVLRRLESSEVAALIGSESEEETEAPAETEVAPAEGGISVFNLPSPEDATVNYEPESEEITVTSPSDIKTLVEFYREALPAQGWQEDTAFAMAEENFGMLMFTQDEASLNLTLFNDGFSGETEISISASGMAWGDTGGEMADTETEMGETEIPEIETPQSAFTINDWPIPAEAEEVEIKADEVSYVIDWDFQQVADFYAPTFEEWGLGDSCLEIEPGFNSISCSTGANNISISMNLFDNFDDKTEASFTFFGLAPAEIGGTESGESGELSLSEEEGVPVPSDFDSSSSIGSEFMVELSGASAASVADLVALYRAELPAQGWSEQAAAAEVGDNEAKLAFQGPESALSVTMSAESGQTTLTLKHKMTAAAKEQGILPPAGQVRLYLGSMNEEEITVTLDGQALKVAPTPMDAGPKDTMSVDLEPGSHTYTLSFPGSQEETLELGADETWMLMIGPDGALPLQVY